jgi:aspartate/methionine/tyrosine aminotransferase
MHDLAVKLNDTLKGTCAYDLLSDYGLRMYVPKGIIVQSSEAKEKAKKHNATIGVAMENGSAMYYPGMKAQFADSMKVGEIFPYAPMGGVLALRNAWKADMEKKNPLLEEKITSLPVVTNGLTNALSIVCSLFLETGGDVVLPDMYWENYNLILDEQRQANKILFPIFKGDGFNVEGLDYALTSADDCVMVLLNFPNNPTGYTPTEKESDEIIAVLKKHADNGQKIVLVCDDAYFGLFFDDGPCRQSLFAKACGLSRNILAIKCDAATKEEMVWGFRVAFVTYGGTDFTDAQYDALVQKTMGAIRGSLSSCSMPGQNIILKGMTDPNHDSDRANGVQKIGERYLKLKETLKKYADNEALKPLPFNSGYFMSFWCKPNAEELRKYLLDKYQTGIIRSDDHHIRIAFSSVDVQNIEDLVDTVYKAAGEL